LQSGWDVCTREFETNLVAVAVSPVALSVRRRVVVGGVAN